MRLRNAGNWRKSLPHIKQAGMWRKGEHLFSKVNGQWKDISEPFKPASIIDLSIIPTHQMPSYGERYGYAQSYVPTGTISTDRLNLYNNNIVFASCEWGGDPALGPEVGPWKWFTFHLAGDQSAVPWPQIGLFNDIPLHFHSNVWQPQYGATRVWFRTYRDLPQNQNQHRILI